MSIYVTCRCGQAFGAEPFLAGQTVPCPACGQPLLIQSTQQPLVTAFPPSAAPLASRSSGDATIGKPVVIAGIVAGTVLVLLIGAIAARSLFSDGDLPNQTTVANAAPVAAAAPPRATPPPMPANGPPPVPQQTTISRPATSPLSGPLKAIGKAVQGEGWTNKLMIGGGIYEMDSPHSILIDEQYDPASIYGPTIQGGAYIDSGCKITWAVILKEFDPTMGPIKNPNATLRTIGGMQGIEIRDRHGAHDRIRIAFKHSDHMLTLTLDGRPGTVDSAATSAIVNTLRRVKSAEEGLAAFQAQVGQARP